MEKKNGTIIKGTLSGLLIEFVKEINHSTYVVKVTKSADQKGWQEGAEIEIDSKLIKWDK